MLFNHLKNDDIWFYGKEPLNQQIIIAFPYLNQNT